MRIKAGRLLTVADQAATFLFAFEGGLAAVLAGLDLFGIMVIAFVTALVGGIIRDVLIGYSPPASLRGAAYPLIAFAGAAVVVVIHQAVQDIPPGLLLWSDAAGLALFAVVGATKAIDFKLNPLVAVLLGTVSAVGGGATRDILLNEVPIILRENIYAVAAAAGAAVTVIALLLRLPRPVAMALGFAVCLLLRVVSVWQDWDLPRIG
ncbi:MAG: TRIC cation channel family protein [Nakamurella sp.]